MTSAVRGEPRAATRPIRLNPITFEILRHRLWAINDEAATTMKQVSGSTVATEANDLNTAIMDAAGEVVAVGPYSLAKATTMSMVVKDILDHHAENPGLRPGDAFLCNDAYIGVQHQNDVALVAPVLIDDELVAWVGAEVHQVDMGGPVPGNVQIGARDIYGEAALIPPIRIVEEGVIRADLERHYVRMSRTPDLLSLDLRAKWAACHVATARLGEVADQYGADVLRTALEDILRYTEQKFRARLSELQDGTWSTVTYMDFDETLYPIRLAMTKRGDALIFDFANTAAQAPALVNCTRASLEAVLLGYVCICLCWDMPWSPSAVGRAVTIVSEEGTVVSCAWPGGVCKSTTSVSWAVGKSVGYLIGKLLAGSDHTREHAMASWQGAMVAEEIAGVDSAGRRYGTTVIDTMAGAGGARTWADGIDTGGYLGSMGSSIANVERYEFEYPLLYLYRRQVCDGGGAGAFRGGVSIEKAYIVHGADEIPTFITHCVGVDAPLSPGAWGGLPAGTNQLVVYRDTDVRERLAASRLPRAVEELSGEREVMRGVARTRLGPDDVYACVVMGGGGYGDPLDREPHRVLDDLRRGLVSEAAASELFGVVVEDGEVAADATDRRRKALRGRRLAAAGADRAAMAGGTVVRRLGGRVAVLDTAEGARIGCSCGTALGPIDGDFKAGAARLVEPLAAAGPRCDPLGVAGDSFELRRFLCPGCGAQLAADVVARDEPDLPELELVEEGIAP